MGLNIKNERAHQLIRELAELKGVSQVAALTEAVEHDLVRYRAQSNIGKSRSRYELLMDFADDYAERVKDPVHSWEVNDLLYDEDGLPK